MSREDSPTLPVVFGCLFIGVSIRIYVRDTEEMRSVNDEHSPEARGVSDETNKHTSFDADERGGIVQLVRAEGVEKRLRSEGR
jgi:hypothetical protein